MNTIEIVARAIMRTHFVEGPIGEGAFEGEWLMNTELARDSMEQAKVAIHALREPSDAMLAAGVVHDDATYSTWIAMIDEALRDE